MRYCLLIVLLSFVKMIAFAQTNVTFEEQGYSSTVPVDLDDFELTSNSVVFQFSSNGTPEPGFEYRGTVLKSGFGFYTGGLIIFQGMSPTTAIIKTKNGGLFDFESIDFINDFYTYNCCSLVIKVTGYSSNSMVSGATFNTNIGIATQLTTLDASGNDNFNSVDEIRIEFVSGSGAAISMQGHGLDNFTWQPAVSSDSDPPVVQSIAPSGSPASTAISIDFAVVFDEDASGVTTDDFELVTTGSASGSISGISGSGTSYTVTVNLVEGAGDLNLNLKSGTNIQDDSGNSGVATFVSGIAHSVDNLPTVVLTAFNTSLSESVISTTGTVTATLSHSYTTPVTVSLATTGATVNSDFTISTTTISINPGSTSGDAIITIADDTDPEDTETLTVSISTVNNGTEDGIQSVDFSITNDDFEFNIKAFLEGPLSGTTMSTALNTGLPANPNTVYSSVLSETSGGIPASAVDWVEIELRTGAAASTKAGTNRAGILKSDGTVVDKDGSAFTMIQSDGRSYYIVIHHRNHLSVMSATAISPVNGIYTHDFTTAQSQSFSSGSDGAKQVGSVFALLAGDADGDGDVDATDLTTWRSQNGITFSYNTTNGDFNLDGVINAVDRNDFQQKNSSKVSQVPTT